MKQITRDEFQQITPPVYVCVVPFSPEEIKRKFNIYFETAMEDGLGEISNALVEIDGAKLWLRAPVTDIDKYRNVAVYMLGHERWPDLILEKLCGELEIDKSQLDDINPDLGPVAWKLVRLDDNGSEIDMFYFMLKDNAEWTKRSYESKGHKQSYYVKSAI